jgi:hypothetical protein
MGDDPSCPSAHSAARWSSGEGEDESLGLAGATAEPFMPC